MSSARSRSKYGNKGKVVDGIKFSSQKEALRYIELRYLKQAGIVRDFEMQPRYVLQEAFRKNGKTIRPIYYIADFLVTYADGHQEIEDVKGRFMTEVFKLKWKLFEKRYPDLTLKLVTKVRGLSPARETDPGHLSAGGTCRKSLIGMRCPYSKTKAMKPAPVGCNEAVAKKGVKA